MCFIYKTEFIQVIPVYLGWKYDRVGSVWGGLGGGGYRLGRSGGTNELRTCGEQSRYKLCSQCYINKIFTCPLPL